MRCVELFAGCGGASLGLRAAGFDSVLQAEWDHDACGTLRASGFAHVAEGDVREAPLVGLGEVGLLWASPPCQAWSNMGKKVGASDARNGWPWVFDAVGRLEAAGSKPSWVVCENVTGMLNHADGCGGTDPEKCRGCYWEQVVVARMQEEYPCVSWRVLDAADYGVPQHRERVFLVAGPAPFRWPPPSHSQRALLFAKWMSKSYWQERGLVPPTTGPSPHEVRAITAGVMLNGLPPERPWVTVRDALGLTKAIRAENTSAVSRSVDEVAPTVGTKGVLYTHPRPGDARTTTTGIRAVSVEAEDEEVVGDGDDWLEALCRLGASVVPLRAPEDRRRLTVAECGLLQGFPPDLPLQGDLDARYRQVGNAVPPPLAEAIGRAITLSALYSRVGEVPDVQEDQ